MTAVVPSLAQRVVKTSAVAADRLRHPVPGVVVLIYHRVGARSGLEIDLPVDLFESQIAELATWGCTTTLDDALALLTTPAPAAPDQHRSPVVVTFDDGTVDFAEVALPILERHQVPVALYLATDFVERGRPFPSGGHPLSWGAIADAHSTGLVTLGSHTHTHALLDRASEPDVEVELDRSTGLIGERLGIAAEHFAYPKAVAGSPAADAAVRRRFRSAALAGTRPNPYGRTDPHRLARSPIQVADGMRWFRHKAAGGMALEDALRRALNRRRYAGQAT
jgi:peptidoglycan/xylan/chitin deacetylase (PgdA/CDA1 family)